MRPYLALLIIGLAVFAYFTLAPGFQQAAPENEAVNFIQDIHSGDFSGIVHHLGAACRCPIIRGSYVIYRSGQEPNLAFLVGRPFEYEKPSPDYSKSNEHGPNLPQDKPKDAVVSVQLAFERDKYAPYFLPLPLAYGKTMSYKELLDFAANPDNDAWKGFTLRLRPALRPGSIITDQRIVSEKSWPQFLALESQFSAFGQKGVGLRLPDVDQTIIKKTLGESATEFLVPQDAGSVIREGTTVPCEVVEQLLPRLKSIILRIHIVRVAGRDQWTVASFAFHDAILTTGSGTQKIKCERSQND